ncbi:MAG: zinc-dependent alcohol dehydrogenase family protein [Sporolactobacillus sp.]
MKAAVLKSYKDPLVIEQVPDPEISADGAIIEVKACGVCRSDWHGWKGEWTGFLAPLPHILGHEMSGEIVEVGSRIKNFKKGDRVIVPFTQGDGTCPQCQAGHSNVCDHQTMPGFTYNGGFAQFVAIPNADINLKRLPDGVEFLEASAMGCRFMTAFHGVTSVGNIHPGEWVAIYGAGGVGLSAIQIATAIGASVIAVDIAEDKLKFAERLGAVATINSRTVDAPEAIKDLTHGGANVSVDALGIQDTMLNAVNSLAKRGRHVQIGMTAFGREGMLKLPINDLIAREISFNGSFGMPIQEYTGMLHMVEKKYLRPARLITRAISLEGIDAAFNDMTTFSGMGVTVVDEFREKKPAREVHFEDGLVSAI